MLHCLTSGYIMVMQNVEYRRVYVEYQNQWLAYYLHKDSAKTTKYLETLQIQKEPSSKKWNRRLCGGPGHRMVLDSIDLLLVVPVAPVAPLQGRCRGRRGMGPGAVTAGLAGTATGWGCGGQGAGGRTVRLVGHCFASDHHVTSMTMLTSNAN